MPTIQIYELGKKSYSLDVPANSTMSTLSTLLEEQGKFDVCQIYRLFSEKNDLLKEGDEIHVEREPHNPNRMTAKNFKCHCGATGKVLKMIGIAPGYADVECIKCGYRWFFKNDAFGTITEWDISQEQLHSHDNDVDYDIMGEDEDEDSEGEGIEDENEVMGT